MKELTKSLVEMGVREETSLAFVNLTYGNPRGDLDRFVPEEFVTSITRLVQLGYWLGEENYFGISSPMDLTNEEFKPENEYGYFEVFVMDDEQNITFRPFQEMIHETAKYYLKQPNADVEGCSKALKAFDKEIERLEENHDRWKKLNG